jgi:hypothetical protein
VGIRGRACQGSSAALDGASCYFPASGGKPSIRLNHSTQLTGGRSTCAASSKTVSNNDLLLAFHFHPQMPRSENSFTPGKRRLSASARRALEMLATGFATEKIMIDQGFTRRLLIGLTSRPRPPGGIERG